MLSSSPRWQSVAFISVLGVSLVLFICTWHFRASQWRQVKESSLQQSKAGLSEQRVLVTGAAGFIGFHLAKTLAADARVKVVAIDNFNDYYDVRLKIDRAYELSKLGITVYSDDLCNEPFIHELFSRNNFTHVAHLAAQAGVRYSLRNPQAYIRANVQCQIVLFETLRMYPHVHTVYASSSSVYGKEASIPFRLDAQTDRPGNMYAATKRTDELLSLHYCQQHGLSLVGLRFFTVYGPWGRPDMAVYTFAEAMVMGKEVPLFHVDEGDKVLGRDFTYVDDIVAGIVSALKYAPSSCGERFNLGYGHPVSVPKMLNIIEYELEIPARIKKLPLPPSEILQTWADISSSQYFLNFSPQINLTIGVREFISWYKSYQQQRKLEQQAKTKAPAEIWFDQLVSERDERKEHYRSKHIEEHNEAILMHLEEARNEYNQWAVQNGVIVPHHTKDPFHFHQGKSISSRAFETYPELANNTEALKAQCRNIVGCIAFSSDGLAYSSIPSSDKFSSSSTLIGEQQGLYVADIDMCKEGLHMCKQYESCRHKEPGNYECYCADAFKSVDGRCVPRYGFPRPVELTWKYDAIAFSPFNVTEMKKQHTNMVHIEGLVSDGSTYLVADQHANDRSKLEKLCMEDALCIGVTMDGYLQQKVSPFDQWKPNRNGGMLVYDFDYCKLSPTSCSSSNCKRQSEGKFVCEKKEAPKPVEKVELKHQPNKDVHVVYSFDEKELQGVVASMNSVLISTHAKVIFHLIVCGRLYKSTIQSYINCYHFNHSNHEILIQEFDMKLLDATYKKYQDASDYVHGYLSSCGNYARFFIARLLPDNVELVVYMDIDIAIRKDLNLFIEEANELHEYPYAFLDRPISHRVFVVGKKKQEQVMELYKTRYGTSLDLSKHAFNAGFFVANLTLLRQKERWIKENLHYWMKMNIEHKLWYPGTQSLMLMTFHQNVQYLRDSDLYLEGLGWRYFPDETVQKAFVLHWNGSGKPWKKQGYHISTWRSFLPAECPAGGTCTEHKKCWSCKR